MFRSPVGDCSLRLFYNVVDADADGTTIYMVRDIAGAIQRFEKYKFDKMIYVVGDQQDLHCKRNRRYL